MTANHFIKRLVRLNGLLADNLRIRNERKNNRKITGFAKTAG